MTQHLNQQAVLKQLKQTNLLLAAIFTIVSTWVISLYYQQYKKNNKTKQTIQNISEIHIHRDRDQTDIVMKRSNINKVDKESSAQSDIEWQISIPYQGKASAAVVQAFVRRLNNDCIAVPIDELPRQPETIATVTTNNGIYGIGEVNTVSDRVYVSHQNEVALCDKLVAAIALAPAIHFMDKNLYDGELTALVGQYGTLSKTQDVDLSVLDINSLSVRDYNIENNSNPTQNNPKKLTLTSTNDSKDYQVTVSQDKQFLLLYSEKKQLIYAIPYQPSIVTILGL